MNAFEIKNLRNVVEKIDKVKNSLSHIGGAETQVGYLVEAVDSLSQMVLGEKVDNDFLECRSVVRRLEIDIRKSQKEDVASLIQFCQLCNSGKDVPEMVNPTIVKCRDFIHEFGKGFSIGMRIESLIFYLEAYEVLNEEF